MDDERKDRLLAKLGLKRRNPEIHHAEFEMYTRPSYRGSPEEETDQVYRMMERILIHRRSGVRVSCLEEEDYFGENVEYFMMCDFHIITADDKRHDVVDVDMDKEMVTTHDGNISFDQVSRKPT